MKRIIISLLLILVLCGCSAKADIVIKSNGDIDENIEIIDDINNAYTDDYDSYDEYIDSIITEELGTNRLSQYTKKNIVNNESLGVNLSRNIKTNDFCTNIKNSSLIEIIDDIECSEKKGVYTITGIPNYFICKDDCMFAPELNSATVNITLPNKAISHNANYVSGKTYTWNFSTQKTEPFELEFSLAPAISNAVKNNPLIIVIVIIGFVAILAAICSILYRKYKNNRLDY